MSAVPAAEQRAALPDDAATSGLLVGSGAAGAEPPQVRGDIQAREPVPGAPAGEPNGFGPGGGDDPALRAGQRIEAILGQFSEIADPRATRWAEDLVRAVSDLYGASLARVVALTSRCPGGDGTHQPCLEALIGDELVAGMLVVHDLHPRDLAERVTAAVGGVMASVASADAKVLRIDPRGGAVRLRLLVEPGSVVSGAALERQLRRAVQAGAPEIETVEIDRPPAPTPVRLVPRR